MQLSKIKIKIKIKMTIANSMADKLNLNFIGWKSYNKIKKKAMEQEFTLVGLFISLSIAFFIVFASAQSLNLIYESMQAADKHDFFINQKVYYLEKESHLNHQADISLRDIFRIKTVFANANEGC